MNKMQPEEIRRWFEQELDVVIKWGIGGKPDEGLTSCPFHEDHKPSLILNCEKGVWKCLAGCGQGGIKALAERLGVAPPWERQDGAQGSSAEMVFQYHDESGVVIYEMVRYMKNGEKQFFARKVNSDGTTVKSLQGVTPVPYRLPELLQGIAEKKTIYVAEGEKCVETLAAMGLVATCNHGGAGRWKSAHTKWFKVGVEVVVLPDADTPGIAHAQDVARQLTEAGCCVRLVELGYPYVEKHGKDIADWIIEGHSAVELQALVGQVAPWTMQDEPVSGVRHRTSMTAKELMSADLPEINWVVSELIPAGLTLLVGRPKSGKSWLALPLAMAVSLGAPFLPSTEEEEHDGI